MERAITGEYPSAVGTEVALAKLDQRTTTLEREVSELKRQAADHHSSDTSRWDGFLIAFGKLEAKVEGLNGRMAGYLLAGMLLASVVAVVAQYALRGR